MHVAVWPLELVPPELAGRLPFSMLQTCAGGENLVGRGNLDKGPGPPDWEISGRQAEWRPPLSELC